MSEAVGEAAPVPAPRRRVRADVRRGALLRSAAEVFGRRNFAGAKVADIARAAGISEALIYKHFRSKKALFLAAFAEASRFLNDRMEEVLAGSEDYPLESLKALYAFFLSYLRENPAFARMMLLSIAETEDPDFRAALVENITRARKTIKRTLRAGIAKGTFRADLDLEALSWLFVASYQLMVLLEQLGGLAIVDEKVMGGILAPILAKRSRRR